MECFEQHDKTQSLQGQAYIFQNDKERATVIEKAFDYRGDITLTLSNGETLDCYIYNRVATANPPYIDTFPKDNSAPRRILYSEIQSIAFTGKDTADGKSYEAWKSKKESERAAESAKIKEEMRQKGYL